MTLPYPVFVVIVSRPWALGPVSSRLSSQAKKKPRKPRTEKIHIPGMWPAGFSALATYWAWTEHSGARALTLLVAAVLIATGLGLYLLAGVTFTLYSDSLRGLVLLAVATALPRR